MASAALHVEFVNVPDVGPCLQEEAVMPLYKGELSVDAPAAARALIAQQARKMLSEIAHDRMCVSDELER